MNQSTLNHFIGKAFSTIDLKPGMIKIESKALPIGHENCTDSLENHQFKKTKATNKKAAVDKKNTLKKNLTLKA